VLNFLSPTHPYEKISGLPYGTCTKEDNKELRFSSCYFSACSGAAARTTRTPPPTFLRTRPVPPRSPWTEWCSCRGDARKSESRKSVWTASDRPTIPAHGPCLAGTQRLRSGLTSIRSSSIVIPSPSSSFGPSSTPPAIPHRRRSSAMGRSFERTMAPRRRGIVAPSAGPQPAGGARRSPRNSGLLERRAGVLRVGRQAASDGGRMGTCGSNGAGRTLLLYLGRGLPR